MKYSSFSRIVRYGPIRQIRLGNANDTRGTAYVVYEDIFDAMTACQRLSGFNLMGRFLIILYHQPQKMNKKKELEQREKDLKEMKSKYGIN